MQSRFYSIVAVSILAMSGCMYNGGAPYGYGPGPYSMPQQPWTGSPQGAYPYYNPNPTPVGQPYIPGNDPQPTPMNGPGGTYKGDDGTSAPPFGSSSPGKGNVPDNPTDDPLRPSSSNSPSLSPTSSTSRTSRRNLQSVGEFAQEIPTQLQNDFGDTSTAEENPVYLSPIKKASSSEDGSVDQANFETGTVPYGHHPKFEWMQGSVNYNEADETWVLMYTDNPLSSDKLGGVITLANHPLLRRLKEGDVVRIEGSFDRTAKDSRQRPLYRISRIGDPQNL